jgi:hypothetical protein
MVKAYIALKDYSKVIEEAGNHVGNPKCMKYMYTVGSA